MRRNTLRYYVLRGLDAQGNVRAHTDNYQTSLNQVFSAGDMRRGQSLVM